MGAVYVAEQLSTGRQRALKLMAPELVDNPETRERFVREAKIAAAIESDHVVETVTAGVDDASGAPYLVMELLRGEELADALGRTGPLALVDLKEIFAQIGHALEQAHARGVVHRDLKPENVFLTVSKRRDVAFTAKILDFGIAKLVADGIQKTGTQPLGSPLFMAPEQTDRRGRVCPATDVWALGLMAFYLLTGRSYWLEADGGSLPGLLREICLEPLPLASQRAAELQIDPNVLPHGFDAWFARCVDRNIDARFQEAGAATQAFQHLVGAAASPERRLKLATMNFDNASAPVPQATAATAFFSPEFTSGGSATASGGGTMAAVASTTAAQKPKSFPWAAAVGVAVVATGVGGFLAYKAGGASAPSTARSAAESATSAEPPTGVSASATVGAPPPAGACPEGMLLHPKGTTFMGSRSLPEYAGANVDGLRVTLSAFCIDKTEVTVEAYEKCVQEGDGACERTADDVNYSDKPLTKEQKALYTPFCNARKADRAKHPINCVNYKMAAAYCNWKGLRLPTEAEWEYAARGKGQNDYPWGHEPPDATRLNAAGLEFKLWATEQKLDDPKAMYEADDAFVGTAPVGSFPKGQSSYGVLDLAGNVWEWVSDYYGPYTPIEVTNPKGATSGTERVIRGGSFNGSDPQWANPAWRYKMAPDRYSHVIGFRCAGDAK